jgi:hypothetical protein
MPDRVAQTRRIDAGSLHNCPWPTCGSYAWREPDAAEIWLKRALAEDPSESPGVTRSRRTPKFLHLARNERMKAEVFRR